MPRKFAVGDKVRVLMDKVPPEYVPTVRAKIGEQRVAIIVRIIGSTFRVFPNRVEFANGVTEHFADSELELVTRKGGKR